ncbi:MAG: DUF1592 domain-containing protein [Polyangiaceae bacterium]
MRSSLLAASIVLALAGGSVLSACSGDIGKLPFETGGSGGTGGSPDPVDNPTFAPAPGGIRRLLARQYKNSIKMILGDAAAQAATPPEDVTLSEFETLAAAELSAPPSAVEAYETSARAVSDAVIADTGTMAKIVPCVPLGADDADCHRQVVERLGHQLWRRVLTEEEIAAIVAIAQDAATEYGDFDQGVKYALMTLLESPYFLYTIEVGEVTADHPDFRTLTGPELATRLSLFLIDTTPDSKLLAQAENGNLATTDDVRAAAQDLLQRPEARTALSSFYDVVFKLRDLPTTTKLPEAFPEWNTDLANAMRQESLLFFEDIIWNQNADYRDIFTANYTFVDSHLASLYGVDAPASGFQKTTLPAEQMRSGFLGHAAYLSRYAHAGDTSPTRRGVFISNFLVCNEIPPPPPGVNTQFPPFDPQKPQTKKQYLEEIHHKASDNCSSCHALMDPFGYAMESYDGIGKFRTKDENGLPIDPSGEITDFGSFADATALGQLLHDDQRTMNCIVQNLFRQSMGHKETKGERPAILALQKAFADSGYKIQDALIEIVASPAFAYVGEPK